MDLSIYKLQNGYIVQDNIGLTFTDKGRTQMFFATMPEALKYIEDMDSKLHIPTVLVPAGSYAPVGDS